MLYQTKLMGVQTTKLMIRKITIRANSIPKPPTARSSPATKRMEPQPVKKSSRDGRGVVFAVVGAVALVILIVVIASSQGNSYAYAPRQTYASQQTCYPSTPPPPRGYEELGGKTIGQWMKETGTANNNEMTRERNQRLRDFRKIDRQNTSPSGLPQN
jgi:hypothetical protein